MMRLLFIVAALTLWVSQAMAAPRPYVQAYYEHSYQVFVGAGNLSGARKIVEDALYWRKNDARWWRRYAQVCLWQGDSESAVKGWHKVAELTGDPKAQQHVLTLAPLIYNDKLMVSVYRQLLAKKPHSSELINALAAQYELLGQPDKGVAFLDSWYKRYPSKVALRALQDLSVKQRKNLQAHHYFRLYIHRYGVRPDMALTSAQMLWTVNKHPQAYRELSRDSKALGYHHKLTRQLAVMASELGHWDVARKSYRQLAEHGDDTSTDMYRYLMLTRYFAPKDVADVAERAWRRSGRNSYATDALYTWQERDEWQKMTAFIDSLSAEQLATLSKSVIFLRLYASVKLQQKQYAQARRSLEKALAIEPDDNNTRIAWLWLLVDSRDSARLRGQLQDWELELRQNSRYWDALASAHMVLDEPELAARYEKKLYQKYPDKWQRQWSYAQALLAAGRTGQAWPLLHHLWQQLPLSVKPEQQATYKDMQLALTLRFASGDVALAHAKKTLLHSSLSPAIKAQLIAQWAQSENSPELARAWYLRQKQAGKPWSASTALSYAMSGYNIDGVGRILQKHGDRLSRSDKLGAWDMLDEPRMEAHLLAEQQHYAPELAGANNQQEALLLPSAQATSMDVQLHQQGELQTHHLQLAQRWPIAEHSQLFAELTRNRFNAQKPQELQVHNTDTQLGLRFTHSAKRYQQNIYLGYRDTLGRQDPIAQLSLVANASSRWSFQLGYDWQKPADENSLMILGASRSGPEFVANWSPAASIETTIDTQLYRYQDLDKRDLGRGKIINLQATWRPWLSRLSPGLRFGSTHAVFHVSGKPPSAIFTGLTGTAQTRVLPQSYQQQELTLLLGQPDVHIRPHRIHGWLEAGYSYNNLSGGGLVAKAALEGPLLGRDGWQLFMQRQVNTGGSDENGYRIGLQYTFYY